MNLLFHRDNLVQIITATEAERNNLSNTLTEFHLAHTFINNSILMSRDEYDGAVANRIVSNLRPKSSTKVYYHKK